MHGIPLCPVSLSLVQIFVSGPFIGACNLMDFKLKAMKITLFCLLDEMLLRVMGKCYWSFISWCLVLRTQAFREIKIAMSYYSMSYINTDIFITVQKRDVISSIFFVCFLPPVQMYKRGKMVIKSGSPYVSKMSALLWWKRVLLKVWW